MAHSVPWKTLYRLDRLNITSRYSFLKLYPFVYKVKENIHKQKNRLMVKNKYQMVDS